MGYWGTGIKENDNAGDYLTFYFELYDKGLEKENIRKLMDKHFSGNKFYENWIYLAYAQWKCGSLDNDVFQEVLNIQSRGIDKDFWAGNDLYEERENVLINFIEKIRIKRNKIRKRKTKRIKTYKKKFSVGDGFTFKVGYNLFGGAIIINETDNKGYSPKHSSCYQIANLKIIQDFKFEERNFQKGNIDFSSANYFSMDDFDNDIRFEQVTNIKIDFQIIEEIILIRKEVEKLIEYELYLNE